MKDIADHLGHVSLAATQMYAKVDIAALREVGQLDLSDLAAYAERSAPSRHSDLSQRQHGSASGCSRDQSGRSAMKLSQAIEAYIAYKRSLGMGFRSEAVRLARLHQERGRRRYAAGSSAGRPPVSGRKRASDFVLVCEVSHSDSLLPLRCWLVIMSRRALCRAASHRHRRSFNPTSTATTTCGSSLTPPIRATVSSGFSTPDTVRTLLLLLYGTGLRISEALRLNLGRLRS